MRTQITAPLRIRKSTMRFLPVWETARCRGVLPAASSAFTSAPDFTRSSAIFRLDWDTAEWSGVVPPANAAPGEAPARTRASSIGALPQATAICTAVSPLVPSVVLRSMPEDPRLLSIAPKSSSGSESLSQAFSIRESRIVLCTPPLSRRADEPSATDLIFLQSVTGSARTARSFFAGLPNRAKGSSRMSGAIPYQKKHRRAMSPPAADEQREVLHLPSRGLVPDRGDLAGPVELGAREG